MFSQRASSAWQGAQPQKLTVSMLLPGTSTASEWGDLSQSRRQFWPTLTTRHASLVPVSTEALQRERRQMQAKHLWYNLDIRRASGVSLSYHHMSHHPLTLAAGRFVLVCLLLLLLCVFVCFLFCKCWDFLKSSARIRPR